MNKDNKDNSEDVEIFEELHRGLAETNKTLTQDFAEEKYYQLLKMKGEISRKAIAGDKSGAFRR